MEDILQSSAAKRAVRELIIATVATVITTVCAIALVLIVPRMRLQLGNVDESLLHKREFINTAKGGRIQYQLPAKSPEPAKKLQGYKQDLEILSRRFERGRFEMALLPGFKSTDIAKRMQENKGGFTYTVTTADQAAVLDISARNSKATAALHEYLGYLKKNWVYKQ